MLVDGLLMIVVVSLSVVCSFFADGWRCFVFDCVLFVGCYIMIVVVVVVVVVVRLFVCLFICLFVCCLFVVC